MNNLHKIQPDIPIWVKEVIEYWAPWQENYPLTYKISTGDLFWEYSNRTKGRQNWTEGWLDEIKRNRDDEEGWNFKQKFSYDLVTIID